MDCDILIIGAGAFGVSTAAHLAESHPDPSRIILLDVSPYPPPRAASRDTSKVVRADYTDPFYTELGYEALDAWNNNSNNGSKKEGYNFIQQDAFHRTGWVWFDNKGSDKSRTMRENFKSSTRPDAASVTVDLTRDDIENKWDGVFKGSNFDKVDVGYYNPECGWADTSIALRIMFEKAVRAGVRYVVDEAVGFVLARCGGGNNDGVVERVVLKSGKECMAKRVLMSTGAWTSKLMSGIEDELLLLSADRIERQICSSANCVVELRLSEDEWERYRNMPVAIYGDLIDVLPPDKDGILKFNTIRFSNTIISESGHRITCPLSQDPSVVSEQVKAKVTELLHSLVPQFFRDGRKVDIWRGCWDSMTSDGDFLITRHPNSRLSNLYIAAGGSFHGFKFLPIIGRYVVNVLDGVSNGREKDARWGWKTRRKARDT